MAKVRPIMKSAGRHLRSLLVMVALVAVAVKSERAQAGETVRIPFTPMDRVEVPLRPEVHLVVPTPEELKGGVLSLDGVKLGMGYERLARSFPDMFQLRELGDGRFEVCKLEGRPDLQKPIFLGYGSETWDPKLLMTKLKIARGHGVSWVEGDVLWQESRFICGFFAIAACEPPVKYWENLGPLTPTVKSAIEQFRSTPTLIHLHYPDIGLTASFPSDRSESVRFRLER